MQRKELTDLQCSESQVALGEITSQQLREEAEIRERQGLQAVDEGQDDSQTRANPGVEAVQSPGDNGTSGPSVPAERPDTQVKVAAEMGVWSR